MRKLVFLSNRPTGRSVCETHAKINAVNHKPFTNDNLITTREKIIRSALSLIAEGGTEHFTASNLIAHAHISKGALYHHFASLEEVLMAALHYRSQEPLTRAEQQYQLYPSLNVFLEAFFQEILPLSANSNFVSKLFFFNQKGVMNTAFRESLCNFSQRFTSRMAHIIQHYYPLKIDPERLNGISHTILFTLEGISAHTVIQENEQHFPETWRWLVGAIVRDLVSYRP